MRRWVGGWRAAATIASRIGPGLKSQPGFFFFTNFCTNSYIRIHIICTFFIQIVWYKFIQFIHFLYKLYCTNSYNELPRPVRVRSWGGWDCTNSFVWHIVNPFYNMFGGFVLYILRKREKMIIAINCGQSGVPYCSSRRESTYHRPGFKNHRGLRTTH